MVGYFTTISGSFSQEFILYKVFGYALFCFTLRIGLLRDRDYLSPFTLFATSPFAILLYSDYLSASYLPLPEGKTMAYILFSQYSFFMGLWLRKYGLRTKAPRSRSEVVKGQYKTEYSYILLGLLGLFPYILALFLGKSFVMSMSELTAERVSEFRSTFNIPIVSSLAVCLNGALLCAARRKLWIAVWIIGIISLSVSLLTVARGSVVVLFLTFVIAFKSKRIRWKKSLVVCGLLVVFGIFQLYSYIRQGSLESQEYESSYERYRNTGRIEEVPDFLKPFYFPYMYMTTPLSNYDYIVEGSFPSANGKLTLWPLISTFQLKRLFGLESYSKPIRLWPYNTHAFMADFYLDFGLVGILILPAALGMFVYFYYTRSKNSEDPLIEVQYTYIGFAVLLMFFSNHFTSVAYPLRVIIIFESYRLISSWYNSRKQDHLES